MFALDFKLGVMIGLLQRTQQLKTALDRVLKPNATTAAVCTPSREHLRSKVTPDFHLTYSKNGGNMGSESK